MNTGSSNHGKMATGFWIFFPSIPPACNFMVGYRQDTGARQCTWGPKTPCSSTPPSAGFPAGSRPWWQKIFHNVWHVRGFDSPSVWGGGFLNIFSSLQSPLCLVGGLCHYLGSTSTWLWKIFCHPSLNPAGRRDGRWVELGRVSGPDSYARTPMLSPHAAMTSHAGMMAGHIYIQQPVPFFCVHAHWESLS